MAVIFGGGGIGSRGRVVGWGFVGCVVFVRSRLEIRVIVGGKVTVGFASFVWCCFVF